MTTLRIYAKERLMYPPRMCNIRGARAISLSSTSSGEAGPASTWIVVLMSLDALGNHSAENSMSPSSMRRLSLLRTVFEE